MKVYSVYILTNRSRTLYTGVTGSLLHRIRQHRAKLIEGFTKRYNITQLVYVESTSDIRAALAREKQIKSWTRRKKIELIESLNPDWADLAEPWFEDDPP